MIPSEDGSAFVPHSGGSVFNTAIGLGRQGVSVGLLSGVSNDLFGQQLCEALSESDVLTDSLIRSDRPTTLAFVKLIDGKASYAFYDENTAGRMLFVDDTPDRLHEGVKALFFGGISLAVEPCAEAYVALLKRFAADHLIMVDPNIRPSFMEDETRYRARLDDIVRHADIIKISDEDLDWVDQRTVEIEDKAAALLAKGPSLVCLTRGSQGAKVFSKSQVIESAGPPKVDVIDTVGAGDAFNAGFLTCLDRSGYLSKDALSSISAEALSEAIDFASAFATDTVTRPGSDPAWNFRSSLSG